MRQAQRRGDFDAAWDAYIRFFQHPDRNAVDMLTFGRCFAEKQCPYFDSLGAYLGKTKRELDTLGSFCPDWQEWWETSLEGNIKPGTTPENIAYIKGVPERMLTKGLGSNCDEWRRKTRTLLHDQGVDRSLPQVDVQLRLRAIGPGIVPEVAVRVGAQHVWALVDTGATQFFLGGEPDTAAWGLSPLVATSRVWTSRGFVSAPDVRLKSLSLGGVPLVSQFTASLKPSQFAAGIGMNLLMHYDSVCFDWQNRKLRLGRLDSCTDGHRARTAIISPDFLPYVEAGTTGGGGATATSSPPPPESTSPSGWPPLSSSAWVLIDTGATENHCSVSFAESAAVQKDGRFAFGDGLTAVCTNIGNTVFEDPNLGLSAILGMETLLEFDAFGWELDPFKVYFVPRQDD